MPGLPARVQSAISAVSAAYADTTLAALLPQLDVAAQLPPLREVSFVGVACEQLLERRLLAGVVWSDTTVKGNITARQLCALLFDVTRGADVTYVDFGFVTLAAAQRRALAVVTSVLDSSMSAANALRKLEGQTCALLSGSNRTVSLRDLWFHFSRKNNE